MSKTTKLGKGVYSFVDINTRKKYNVRASDATSAVRKLNQRAGKKVNYSFLGYHK